MKSLLLIDGNAIMHRAYYALPPMTTAKGIPTNAIYGFFGMLHGSILSFKPQYLIVCFDTPAETFRQKMYKEYQANRPSSSDDFKTQIPYIRRLLDVAGIRRIEQEGYEADDVIGTLARRFKKKAHVLILTGDKDIMQLVDDQVSVITPLIGISSSKTYGVDDVVAKLGVLPGQIPDYKALAGDPSDNYKGAKGIGQKTAVSLIKQYGTIENLYTEINMIPKKKIKNLLLESKDDVIMMKKLATIVTDLDLDITLQEAEFHAFNPEMKHVLEELQFYSLIKRLFPSDINKTITLPPPAEKKKMTPLPQASLFET